MGENDVAFKAFIKKITFGKYLPPCAATCLSELLNLAVETEKKSRKIIDDYQKEGLMVSILTDIWVEDGKP